MVQRGESKPSRKLTPQRGAVKEFLRALDAEERRLEELIRLLEAGAIATVPPRPPVSEVVAASRLQLDGGRRLLLVYGEPRPTAATLN